MVSHPKTGWDSPIGSDRDWGRDNEAFCTPCLQVFFVFCFRASYRKANSGIALSPPGGAGKEEKERKTENSGFP